MSNISAKKRFRVFSNTVVASLALFGVSYYITHVLVYSSFSKFTVRVFDIMQYFRYVIAVDLIILAAVVWHLMTVSRLKGNIDRQKGFLYAFFYILLLAVGFTVLLMLKKI
ncbi:MAG TPA: hypothetical protein PLR88_12780 [Bacteroidales bacterium]|nr:hypothetical protein [Bacteroidales bacterium]HPT22813.1 hypothetical protein [Bacteroidales bacterium]